MDWLWVALLVGAVGAFLMVLAWRPMRRFGREVQVERARELFKLQRERLETIFLAAAAATGKPRGLLWKDCRWNSEVEFVRERRTGQIAALVGIAVQFEAIEGGDMEGVPAVGDLKTASAVFFFHRGQWQTVGKAVFNMQPSAAVEHFKNQYERVFPHG